MKPFVDHRDEELLATKAQKLHLAGAVPIPGMTGVGNFSAASPQQAALADNGTGRRCAPNDSVGSSLPPTNTVVVHVSPKRQSPQSLNGLNESVTVVRSPPTVYSECYEDKDGKKIKKTTKHTQVITTKTFRERYATPLEEESDIPSEHDIALERAIQMTTRLDPDLFVVTSRVGSDHSHYPPSSNAGRRTSGGNTRNPAAYISS
ncbi:unnamed protein product [Dibothriocephalus latus]|uniref:Uncharacterized protein n=1 Tax=Dibothriocephalus latus TaxID=60516 RepID=A0A3P7LFN2_DIBLA|nr:unnamed protein product [Dibothriocephalus latus]